MTHGLLSKCIIIISQGIGIVCLNVMFFHCLCWFPDSGFFQKILFDLGRELNLIKRHFVFKKRVSFLRKLYILEQGLLLIIKEHGLRREMQFRIGRKAEVFRTKNAS